MEESVHIHHRRPHRHFLQLVVPGRPHYPLVGPDYIQVMLDLHPNMIVLDPNFLVLASVLQGRTILQRVRRGSCVVSKENKYWRNRMRQTISQ